MVLYLLQGMTFGFSATIMPGPLQAFLLSYTLKNGWKRTLPASFAPLATDGAILTLVILVLSKSSQDFLALLRIAGGLFILYLARGVFRTLKQVGPALEPEEGAARKSFLNAVTINFLNPNPYMFWSMVGGPIVLSGWRESAGLGIAFLAAFFGTFVCGLAGLILLFGFAGKLNSRMNRVLRVVALMALLAFGLYQLGVGVSTLVS